MNFVKDLRNTFNALSAVKSFSISVVATMAIVMGALVASFNLNYQILQVPLPYPNESSLFVVEGNNMKRGELHTANVISMAMITELYRSDDKDFDQKALFNYNQDVIRDLPDSPMVKTAYVTPEFLDILDAGLEMGRKFNKDEGIDKNVPVAILSYATWNDIYKKDPQVLNKTLVFNDVTFNIIGVLSADFVEPEIKQKGVETQVWLPFDYNLASPFMRKAWNGTIKSNGMLVSVKDGGAIAKIGQELTNTYNARYVEELSGRSFFKERTITVELKNLKTAIVGENKELAMYLFVGALSITLIAVTNVLNLFLSRTVSNQKNLAIKVVLGAQKSALFYTVFIEVLVLMLAASILSLLISTGFFELLKLVSSNQFPRLNEVTIGLPSIGFSLLCALLITVVVSFVIQSHIKYDKLNTYLQSSGKGTSIQISGITRQFLIISQVALTGVILFISTQLFLNSAGYLSKSMDFKIDNVTQVVVNIGTDATAPITQIQANSLAIRKEFENHPKVVRASATFGFPISAQGQLPDRSGWSLQPDRSTQKRSAWISADENYLETLGLTLKYGRNFSYEEVYAKAQAVIVNEALAKQIQPDGDILNKMLYWASNPSEKVPYEVVGIIEDFELLDKKPPFVILPSSGARYPEFLIELQPNQSLSNIEVNEILGAINNKYKVASQLKMKDAYNILMADETLTVWLSSALAFLAIFLAAVGIFGVVSYNVKLRKFDLGIRMAIGANNQTIYKQLLLSNLKPTVLGLTGALLIYALMWFYGDLNTYIQGINVEAWVLSIALIVSLVSVITLMSVWRILTMKPIYALRNN